MDLFNQDDIRKRMLSSVELAWEAFQSKVSSGLIDVNKEASMQLHFSSILSGIVNLLTLDDEEKFSIELETSFRNIKGKNREVDILYKWKKDDEVFRIAIELKCYREWSDKENGKRRGATDIFKKDVFEDIELVEEYCRAEYADLGLCLVMTDYKGLVEPSESSRKSKAWKAYDVSPQSNMIKSGTYEESIGGKDCKIVIKNNYECRWIKNGNFWYLKLV
jgi:hypothetical protein